MAEKAGIEVEEVQILVDEPAVRQVGAEIAHGL